MNLITQEFNDDRIRSLICFCCGQIHVSWIGLDTVGFDFAEQKSPICMVQGRCVIEEFIGNREHRKLNFEEVVFRERYMEEGMPLSNEPALRPNCWEWRRILQYSSGQRVPIMCCPEDVLGCTTGAHEAHVICGDCRVPLCMKCGLRMLAQKSIPMAIANHNFIGYCAETLVKYRVRWIEAAIVCPAWTTMICFYMEEDRGHLMREEQFAAKYRIGVRGNIFSFPMPWVDIMKSLLQASEEKALTVPHPPEILAHMVRLHLKIDSLELTRHLKEICVRHHVLLQLGDDLIEARHPALMKRSNAGPVPRAEIARIKAAFRRLLETYYPAPTDATQVETGVVPAAVWQVCQESLCAKQKASPLHDKNATPQAGVMSASTVFDAVQPQMVVAERSADAGCNAAEVGHAALSRYKELHVQTGNTFVPQWKPQYLSEVFCHEFKHVTGGPEYDENDKTVPWSTSSTIHLAFLVESSGSCDPVGF